MTPKKMIIKAFEREMKNRRGLRIITPESHLVNGHMNKADHNLIVMTDLDKLKHSDWVVITAYYSMYHAATAILAKIGLDSKDHATTVAVLEYFFGEKIENRYIQQFNALEHEKNNIEKFRINEKDINYLWTIKKTREIVQYGIDIDYKETKIIMNNARGLVTKIKLMLREIDDIFISSLTEDITQLQKEIRQ